MSINILIFNCGSSSLSCQIFQYASKEDKNPQSIFSAKGHRVSTKSTEKPFIEYHLKPNKKDLTEQYDTLTHALACNKMIRFLHKIKSKFPLLVIDLSKVETYLKKVLFYLLMYTKN